MLPSEHSVSSASQKNDAFNHRPGTNTFVFGILLILTQIAIAILYGFFVTIPERTQTNAVGNFLSMTPIFINFLTYFLIIVGFGLVFAYEKRLIWSAIGFNLLITCLSVEWFFLMNFFWTKVDFDGVGRGFSEGDTYNNIYLWNSQLNTDPDATLLTYLPYGATLTMALKASLANCVAFSSILGKAGPLEAWFVSAFGTFGFQLCRNVIKLLDIDFGDGFAIFAYGGFMGLMMGVILNCKYRNTEATTAAHPFYVGSSFAGAFSFFGACILFSLFPVLLLDPPPALQSPIRSAATHPIATGPQSVWYTICAGVMVSSACSVLVYGKIIGRDMINGVVAGGVCSLSASYYLTNPVWAMVLGGASGILQMIGQSIIETNWAKQRSIINTYSFTTFGPQALLGGVWGSIFRAVIISRTDGFTYDLNLLANAGYSLLIAVIAAGIGIGFGTLLGAVFACLGKHDQTDHFHDYTYWVPDDGIRYDLPVSEGKPVSVVEFGQFDVKEEIDNIKQRHAYL